MKKKKRFRIPEPKQKLKHKSIQNHNKNKNTTQIGSQIEYNTVNTNLFYPNTTLSTQIRIIHVQTKNDFDGLACLRSGPLVGLHVKSACLRMLWRRATSPAVPEI